MDFHIYLIPVHVLVTAPSDLNAAADAFRPYLFQFGRVHRDRGFFGADALDAVTVGRGKHWIDAVCIFSSRLQAVVRVRSRCYIHSIGVLAFSLLAV